MTTSYLYKIIYFIIFPLFLFGQERPEILLDDVVNDLREIRCYCQPGIKNKSKSKGVEVSYSFANPGTFNFNEGYTDNLPAANKFSSLIFKGTLPIIRQERSKLIFSYSHRRAQFNMVELGSNYRELYNRLDGLLLKSNRMNLTFSTSLNEKNYLILKANYKSNGDYEDFFSLDKRYKIMNWVGVLGFKKDNKDWGFGLAVSDNFRREKVRFAPLLYYNYNFNDRWGIESVIPTKIKIRHNLKCNMILLAGFSYHSETYSFDAVEQFGDRPLNLNHSEILASVTLQKEIIPWVWFETKIGFQRTYSHQFDDQNSYTRLLNADPGNTPYFKFSIFISPPDSYLQAKKD